MIRKRVTTYIVLAVLLAGGYAMLRVSSWQGSTQLHTLMEVIATLLALFIGVMALLRFYSNKNNTILFIGTGFLGTGLLDAYHAIVTSSFFNQFFPSPAPSLIPWSWNASRIFLSIFLYLSWLAWRREARLGENGRIRERAIYLTAAGLTLASFLFSSIVPLPRAYYPEIIFHRPEEFVSAVFFLLALVGFWSKGQWRDEALEHWLVLSLIVAFIGQTMFMSFSGQLFDMMFDAAHLLKKVSYIFVLIGLLISMYRLFKEAETGALQIKLANEELLREVEERSQAETERRKLAEYLDTILLNLPTGVAILEGPDFRYFRINNMLAEINGLSIEDHLGRTLAEVLPAAAPDIQPGLNRVLQSGKPGQPREFSTRLPKDPQKDRHFIDTFFPIFGEEGKPRGVGAVVVDITERKRAEQHLRESEDRYRSLFDSMPVGLFRTSPAGQIIDANQALMSMFGYPSRESFLEVAISEFYVESGGRRRFQALMDKEGIVQRLEEQQRKRDGTIIWTEVNARAVTDGNEIVYYEGSEQDITERKKVEERMRTLSMAVEQNPSSIMITDAERRIEYVNPQFTETSGYVLAEVIGKNPSILNSGSHPPEFMQQLRDTIDSGRVFQADFCNKKKNGELYWVLQSISPIIDEAGVVTHFVSAQIDDTEHKRAVEALQESEERYRAVVEDQTELIARWLPDGTRTFINESYCRYFDRSYEDLIGTRSLPFEFETTGDREVIERRIQALTPRIPAATSEFQVTLSNGDVRWQQWTDRAIFDEQDRLIEMQSVGRDISEHKRAEEEIIHQASILEQVHNAAITIDFDNKILSWNKHAEMLYQWKSEEAIGRDIIEILSPEELKSRAAENIAELNREGHWEGEFNVLRKDGTTIPAHIINTVVVTW